MANAIFLAFDDAFSLYARACLSSIRLNFPHHPLLHVLYEGQSEEVFTFLKSFPNLRILSAADLPPLQDNFALGEVNSPGIFYKYHLWNPMFDEFENLLYLDVDTLVLKPLDDLMSQQTFFAVPNHDPLAEVRIFDHRYVDSADLESLLLRDGIQFPNGMDDMCNAGVLMIPREYRSRLHYERLLEITRTYNSFFRYADQSAISLWIKISKLQLSSQYEFNFQSVFFGAADLKDLALNDISILHFSSPRKPNTVDFMRWERIPPKLRSELARTFLQFAR